MKKALAIISGFIIIILTIIIFLYLRNIHPELTGTICAMLASFTSFALLILIGIAVISIWSIIQFIILLISGNGK